ncbi:hypothetical protein N665_0277s0009 [Sinapis alba]|nr:hypothetical protein N665_0277s0009 [Sinapis alba]
MTTLRRTRSPRRLLISVARLDGSASQKLFSTAELEEESVQLSLRPVALNEEIKSKEIDANPFLNLNFVDLLQSQQDSPSFSTQATHSFGTQATDGSNLDQDSPGARKEQRTWTPTDDVILISSWLNTSKDPVEDNEQRSVAFWKRIAAYFAASPKLEGCLGREASHCKQHWHKINDLVCKFCGAFEAATRVKTSGQNDNDVLKLTHEIFFNNHKKKFTLEDAWKELRNDRSGCSKKRKCDDGSQSASSQAANETDNTVFDEGTTRPPSVKVAKARGKKTMVEGKEEYEFQTMWTIKKQDLAMKGRLSKMKLLDSLIAKPEPFADYEEALKKKLINELLS